MTTTLTSSASLSTLAADAAARVMGRCALIAAITDRPGETLRTFLSPAMDEVHRTMQPWMQASGLAVTIDRAGNLRAVYGAARDDAPRLLVGSHLDTVPNAGAFDGVLGVLMGLALVESLDGRKLPFAIEVIGFSDEEGTRFGVPFLGSRALVGELDGPIPACRDAAGISLAEALNEFRARRPQASDPLLSADAAAYLEFHIEQGPILESRNLPLGIVEGLAAQSRSTVVFRGQAGHAGTTPMKMRHDALAAAAEWMLQVETAANRFENLVATVGQIAAEPGGVNVIPGLVRCSLDVRHAEDCVRDAAVHAMLDAARATGRARGVEVQAEQYHQQAAAKLDAELVEMVEQAVLQTGYRTLRMTSGAGHDAMVIASHLPAAMIFLRNPGGISHHPQESVAEADVAAGLHAGLCFLENFDAWLAGRSTSKLGSKREGREGA